MKINNTSWLSNEIKSGNNVWTINHTEDFLKSLALGLLNEFKGDNHALAKTTILLPTKRSVKSIKNIFLNYTDKHAVLLPKIIPLDELGENEAIDTFNINPSIPKLSRRFLLTQLIIKKLESNENIPRHEVANSLAIELENFLDESQTHNIGLNNLEKILPENLASHWQSTLDFLNIIKDNWPKILEDEKFYDKVERRNKLFESISKDWSEHKPNDLIIAAGTTASITATRKLLKIITTLPTGLIVIPGLDKTLDQESWENIDETHPQYSLKGLLEFLETDRSDIKNWPYQKYHSKKLYREKFITEVMRPKETTNKWLKLNDKEKKEISKNISIIEPEDDQDEALTIALAMRHVESAGDKSCTLITRDDELANNVSLILERWNIKAENSFGYPLIDTQQGTYLQLVLDVAFGNFSMVSLLSLLKHDLFCCGLEKENTISLVQEIEIKYARGKASYKTLEDLGNIIKLEEKESKSLIDWFQYFLDSISELVSFNHKNKVSFSKIIRSHIICSERLANSQNSIGLDRIWRENTGQACSMFLSEIIQNSDKMGAIKPESYKNIFSQLLREEKIQNSDEYHPRIRILSPIESRLIYHDIVIIGGLHEGVWPEELKSGPWLNHEMRSKIGLPKLENKIGLSALDLCHSLGSDEVVIMLAKKKGRDLPAPSRWAYRIKQIYKPEKKNAEVKTIKSENLEKWSKIFYAQNKKIQILPPQPIVDHKHKPRSVRLTDVGLLLRNPYEFYVKNILNLRPLEKVGIESENRLYGTIVHKIFDYFMKKHFSFKKTEDKNTSEFLKLTEKILSEENLSDSQRLLWSPRIQRIGKKYINYNLKNKENIKQIFTEIKGQLKLRLHSNDLAINGKADRVDILGNGILKIVDYKTGSIPSNNKIKDGYEPQLPLLAIMAGNKGFKGISLTENSHSSIELEYWKMDGKKDGFDCIPKKIDNLEEYFQSFKFFINDFIFEDKPYFYQIEKKLNGKYDTSKHLSRIDEWIHNLKMETDT